MSRTEDSQVLSHPATHYPSATTTPSLSSQATMIRRDRPRKLFCCTRTMCAIMLSSVVLFPQSASTASSPPKQVLLAYQRLHCVLILHVVSRCITAFYSLALTFTSVAPPPSILPPPTSILPAPTSPSAPLRWRRL